MNETDVLYERLRGNYDSGILDDPLLCRAFRDAQPNRELAASLEALQASLRACEERRAASEAHRVHEQRAHGDEVQRLNAEHSREIHARDVLISELKRKPKVRPAPKVSYAPGEAKRLKELGWVKSAGD